jgi:hypothetical protein
LLQLGPAAQLMKKNNKSDKISLRHGVLLFPQRRGDAFAFLQRIFL